MLSIWPNTHWEVPLCPGRLDQNVKYRRNVWTCRFPSRGCRHTTFHHEGSQNDYGRTLFPAPAFDRPWNHLDSAPQNASYQWFSEARFGLFVHCVLFSLISSSKSAGARTSSPCWKLTEASITPTDRALCLEVKQELFSRFTAENFDAEAICDLAEAAGVSAT